MNLKNFILEKFTLKKILTCHHHLHARMHVLRLLYLSTFDLSSAAVVSKTYGSSSVYTSKLRTSLTKSYPILMVLSLESVLDQLLHRTLLRRQKKDLGDSQFP